MSQPATRTLNVFYLVIFGEFVSLLGSSLTSFGLGVWAYQHSRSATQFALISLFAVLPGILIAPLAGTLVDRWDRRRVMLVADLGAGLTTLAIAALLVTGRLEVWHIYITAALSAAFSAFQMPAAAASVTLLVPKEKLSQASGLMQLGQAIAQIVAPALAGALLLGIGLPGILLIDFATFLFAVGVLALVKFPALQRSAEAAAHSGSVVRETVYGWRYILARPGLVAMLALVAATNFSMAVVSALFTPMMLTLTTPDRLGQVMTVGGLGMLAGGVTLSVWGGPKRRIHGVLGFLALAGFSIMLGGASPAVLVIAVAAFGFFFAQPLINGALQAIWQTKVAPDVQGRVFSARNMFATLMSPLAFGLAGPLADRVFEPLMAPGGALAGSVGQFIGVGAGRGIGLIFIVMGWLAVAATGVGYLYPRLARVEDELPDAIPSAA